MIKILKYTQLDKGSVIGTLDLQMVKWGGFIIYGCTLFQKNGHKWLGFPSKKIEVAGGEIRYLPHVRFESREMQDKFGVAVLAALDAWLEAGNVPLKPESRPPQPEVAAPQSNVSYGPGSNGAYQECEPPPF
jgi:hypothetical protein